MNLAAASTAMRHAVGAHIRRLRLRRGWTMRQCGLRSGMDRAIWGRVEAGRHDHSLPVLARVADALVVDVRELVAIGAAAWRRAA